MVTDRRRGSPSLSEKLVTFRRERHSALFSEARIRRWKWILIPIFAIQVATVAYVWTQRDEVGDEGRRVIEFVRDMGDAAHVLVDGEYFLGDRARSLLDLLANLSRSTHVTHPGRSFQVLLIARDRRMELLLSRDGSHSDEYRVYLLDEGTDADPHEVGRITTDALEGLEPLRPARRSTGRN